LAAKLADTQATETEELQYSMPDVWALRIFIALCRKHGLRPYRYPRQRRTTVVVRANPAVFEQTVLAEFTELHRELVRYFSETVDHLLADAMRSDGNDDNMEAPQIGST
jgi:hypothetical protein